MASVSGIRSPADSADTLDFAERSRTICIVSVELVPAPDRMVLADVIDATLSLVRCRRPPRASPPSGPSAPAVAIAAYAAHHAETGRASGCAAGPHSAGALLCMAPLPGSAARFGGHTRA
mmetsp:Transcript_5086/g.14418  ORF Transcript_5086/g.14418 Transcript_5086/m.14418 type:complete len:120 (-) Transcript_5086:23-382(-)